MGQAFKHGDIIKANGEKFEVVSISGQGDEGEQHHFKYEIQLQAEAEEQREKEKQLTEEAGAANE